MLVGFDNGLVREQSASTLDQAAGHPRLAAGEADAAPPVAAGQHPVGRSSDSKKLEYVSRKLPQNACINNGEATTDQQKTERVPKMS
jgi:hypothetical protein